jgi:hypothetical protein
VVGGLLYGCCRKTKMISAKFLLGCSESAIQGVRQHIYVTVNLSQSKKNCGCKNWLQLPEKNKTTFYYFLFSEVDQGT